MPRYCLESVHTSVHQYTAWTVPVKVEELKAALRAHIRIQDMRAALPPLPPEITDKILSPIHEDLLDRFQRKWRAFYACSASRNDPRVLGTVYHRINKLFGGKINDTNDIFPYCPGCERFTALEVYRRLTGKTAKEVEDWPTCQRCHAWSKPQREDDPLPVDFRWLERWQDNLDYEDDVIDIDNVWDNHEHADELFDLLSYNDRWLVKSWNQAQESLAREWHYVVDRDLLFTDREISILKSFGVEVKLRHEPAKNPIRHTTAPLIPHDTDKGSERIRCYENAPPGKALSVSHVDVLRLTQKHELAFRRVLKQLRLTPCNSLDRRDEKGGVIWTEPKLVSIIEAEETWTHQL